MYEIGKYKEALSLIEKIVESNPNDEYLQTLMAFILYNLGRENEAKTYFEKALTINPNITEEFFSPEELAVFNKVCPVKLHFLITGERFCFNIPPSEEDMQKMQKIQSLVNLEEIQEFIKKIIKINLTMAATMGSNMITLSKEEADTTSKLFQQFIKAARDLNVTNHLY